MYVFDIFAVNTIIYILFQSEEQEQPVTGDNEVNDVSFTLVNVCLNKKTRLLFWIFLISIIFYLLYYSTSLN